MGIWNKITNMIKYGRVSKSTPDAGNFAKGQVEYQGKIKDVLFVYPYGSHGIPPVDSLILLNNIKGAEENQAGIPFKPDVRPKLDAEGEYVVGNFEIGSIIKFLENGDIEITGKKDLNVTLVGNANVTVQGTTTLISTGNVSITAPLTTINGPLTVTGIITAGALAVTGAAGTSTLAGTITNNATISGPGTITSVGVTLNAHVHTGVTVGPSNTGGPI